MELLNKDNIGSSVESSELVDNLKELWKTWEDNACKFIDQGVIIEDPNTTYIYDDVTIGAGTVIHPNTTIKSDVKIGENCEIGPNSYIREHCNLANRVKIGNNVEIKKVNVGEGSKVPHFIYLGDCTVGKNCNIGCGTITCNYDGKDKHQTIIGDNCFIGSNATLVAPVTIGDGVCIAAGSTITEDVDKNSLAFGRAKQVNKQDYYVEHEAKFIKK